MRYRAESFNFDRVVDGFIAYADNDLGVCGRLLTQLKPVERDPRRVAMARQTTITEITQTRRRQGVRLVRKS
jgi:hypothetical protein